jgi:hypothetical protein
MKLELGMYVRTYKKGILKIKKNVSAVIDGGYVFIDEKVFTSYNIKKSSFNLIDLIEVGDYVNGYEIIANKDEYEIGYFHQNGNFYTLLGTEIKSILTHEQYEANCYKVVE